MKTISELKKSATVLGRKQLKNLLGGAGCAAGQTKYSCFVKDESGFFHGSVCAGSRADAVRQLRSVYSIEGNFHGGC